MLIGSRAIAHWDKNFKIKPGTDWDIIGQEQQDKFWRKKLSIPEVDQIEWHDPYHLNNVTMVYAFNFGTICNPYGLALIYRSHLWRDHNWDGHIAKYWKYIVPLVGRENIQRNFPLDNFLKERIRLTKEAYPQGNPNLNQSNDDFFDDNVKKVYNHDWLHGLYAYEDKPMFERLKKPENASLAWCEKDLWINLTKEQQNQCVAEETYVIATERFMVPSDWKFPTKQAYYMALKKVCTTLCSGWFRDHAIDNFPEIYNLYDSGRFTKINMLLQAYDAYRAGEPSNPPKTNKQKVNLKDV